MKTKVIFRKWKGTGDVIALFPEVPGTVNPAHCLSYERHGQHGAAHLAGVIANTRPASPEESADLARELERIGYELEPVTRTPGNAWDTRRVEISRYHSAA
jgi:hypothetical protein